MVSDTLYGPKKFMEFFQTGPLPGNSPGLTGATGTTGATGAGTPSACTPAIEQYLENPTTFSTWKQQKLTALSGSPSQATLTEMNAELQPILNCFTELEAEAANPQTNLELSRRQITAKLKAIKERTNDIEIAKDRVILAKNPEATRSYYDGWFPVDRPLKHYTIPILIGISLFLFTLSFFNIFSLIGVDTRMIVRVPVSTGSTQFTPAFWGMSAVALALLGLTVYAFKR